MKPGRWRGAARRGLVGGVLGLAWLADTMAGSAPAVQIVARAHRASTPAACGVQRCTRTIDAPMPSRAVLAPASRLTRRGTSKFGT